MQPNEIQILLNEKLPIDIHNLVQQVAEQPELFAMAGDLWANCKEYAMVSKTLLDLKRAELDGLIRTNPDAFGISKITETVVESIITRHKEFQDLQTIFIKADTNAAKSSVLMQAYSQRKSMLELEASLFQSKYWSDVKTNLGEQQIAEQRKNNSQKV